MAANEEVMKQMDEAAGQADVEFQKNFDKWTAKDVAAWWTAWYLNPDFALGRGIRRTMPDFFFLKKLDRRHRYALAFFVEKATASFVSVLAPNAKYGLKRGIKGWGAYLSARAKK